MTTDGRLSITLKLSKFIDADYSKRFSIAELLEDEGADYTAIPKCTRSHILYNHTLLGGLRAGNFTHIAEVDSIETCAALCCAEQTCDLALVLGENCYAGDCASKELCVPVPVHPTANKGSQIAYITSRKKVEEPGTGQLTKKELNLCPDFKRLCLRFHSRCNFFLIVASR